VQVQQLGDKVVILLGGQLLYSPALPRRQLLTLADQCGGRTLELDFSRVEYIGAEALSTLILLHAQMARSRGSLVLSNLSAWVWEVLRTVKLDRYFTIVEEEEAADPCYVVYR